MASSGRLIEYQVNNFKSGVISQRFNGNIDTKDYSEGATEIKNGIVLTSGGVTYRAGTEKVENYLFHNPAIKSFNFKYVNGDSFVVHVSFNATSGAVTFTILDIETMTIPIAFVLALPDWSTAAVENMKTVSDGRKVYMASRGFKPLVLSYNGTAFSIGYFTLTVAWPAGYISGDITSATNDCPGAVAIYEGRLLWGGSINNPMLFWGSRAGVFTDYSYGTPVTDADGYEKAVTVPNATSINWMIGMGPLFFGTDAGIAIKSSRYEIMTSLTSSFTLMASAYGTSEVQGFIMGGEVFFVEKGGKKIRMAKYSNESESYFSPELTYRCENLFDSPIRAVSYQQIPESILWVLLESGKLLSMAYEPTYDVYAWSEHSFGFDKPITSISVSSVGDEEFLFLTAEDDGDGYHHVLKMEKLFEPDQYEMNYLDLAVKGDLGAEVVGGMFADSGPDYPCFVTLVAFPDLVDGSFYRIRVYTTPSLYENIHYRVFEVEYDAVNEWFFFKNTDGTYLSVDGGISGSISVGLQLVTKTISAASIYWNDLVYVYADGAYYGPVQSVAGVVSTEEYVNRYVVGYKYDMTVKPVPPAAGKWRMKRIIHVAAERYRSLGGKVGPVVTNLEPFPTDTPPTLDTVPPLETGVVKVPHRGGSGYYGDTVIVQDLPLPFTLLALMYTIEMED